MLQAESDTASCNPDSHMTQISQHFCGMYLYIFGHGLSLYLSPLIVLRIRQVALRVRFLSCLAAKPAIARTALPETAIYSGIDIYSPTWLTLKFSQVVVHLSRRNPSTTRVAPSQILDFVSNEDEELDLEEVVEPGHRYDIKKTPNVLYPICLGEVLNGRYLIEHKLGFGGFSTVWMAHDLKNKRDIALKIMSCGGLGENEARMQDEIIRSVYDTSHLVTYLTTFTLHGTEGDHRVIVYPLMGPCLCPAILRNMSMVTRMSAAKQLLVALENLHNAGIVHRDLNERNCMWRMMPLDNLSRSAKYQALGRPLRQIIPFVDLEKQGEFVGPIVVPEMLRTEEFYLGDFGLAMKAGESTIPPGYPPFQFCSPDRLHAQDPSFACDMWSYMILFAELYLGYYPFSTAAKGGIISSMVECLGPIPEQWKGLYTPPGALDSWYDKDTTPDPGYDLESTLTRFRPDIDSIEKKHVHSIMSKVFKYHPEERLTATQLLRDPSFKAIMEIYGC